MELKGSQTEKNLMDAFAGESMARNKYTYYASVAKKEGYVQISELFEETAANEKEHAKVHFKFLSGIGNTIENLKAAAAGEHYEQTEMYPSFAQKAREEGFEEIAVAFEQIGAVEKRHEARYEKLLKNIETEVVFKRDEVVEWKCHNCGYIHTGKEALNMCPACKHGKKYFGIKESNY
jgi:rubrerythrin